MTKKTKKSDSKSFSKRLGNIFHNSSTPTSTAPSVIDEDDIHHSRLKSNASEKVSQQHKTLHMSFSITSLLNSELFNPADGLRGWVKVPKGGKVKKGWKKIFLLVKEFKVYSYESIEEIETTIGTVVFDLHCEVFVGRPVSQNELIHANAKDIDSIFKIQSYTASLKNGNSEENIDKKERIAKLTTTITLEEKMLEGLNKILAVTTDAQKISTIGQIDAANKRIRTFRTELSKLTGAKSENSLDTEEFALKEFITELDDQLMDELKKRDALGKLAASDKKKRQPDQTTKDIDVEILVSERLIAKCKENLEILRSNNKEKKNELLEKNKELQYFSDSKGHVFSQRQYFKPTDCAICSEPLWDSKNIGFECSSCKIICHKTCKQAIDISCQNQGKLKNIPPMYFMAEDPQDRMRWLAGLYYYRKDQKLLGA